MLTSEQRDTLKALILEYGVAAIIEFDENRPRQINRILDFVTGLAASAAPAEWRETVSEQPVWAKEIIADLQESFDTEGITENDSGDALVRLSSAIAAVENARSATAMSEAARRVIDAARRMLGRGDTVVSPCFGDRAFISSASDVEALSNALSEFDFAAAKGESK
jgi:hypothetical protein